jgi:hypothetical protein
VSAPISPFVGWVERLRETQHFGMWKDVGSRAKRVEDARKRADERSTQPTLLAAEVIE